MKIKYRLLPKWVEAKLTSKEIDLLLYIAHFQDEYGKVKGIYYRNVCIQCHMCKQTFYESLRSLEKKNIIEYSNINNDYDITILENDFSYPGAFNEGYVNVSRKVFDKKIFHDLKANEKLLLLCFLKITHTNNSSYQIGTAKFYEKYMALFNVTKRVVRNYLHSLRRFFSIGIKDGKYFITYLSSIFNQRREKSEVDQYLSHVVEMGCRRNKLKDVPGQAVNDVVELIKQYKHEAKECGLNIIEIMEVCLREVTSVNGAYIHKLIRERIGFKD